MYLVKNTTTVGVRNLEQEVFMGKTIIHLNLISITVWLMKYNKCLSHLLPFLASQIITLFLILASQPIMIKWRDIWNQQWNPYKGDCKTSFGKMILWLYIIRFKEKKYKTLYWKTDWKKIFFFPFIIIKLMRNGFLPIFYSSNGIFFLVINYF